MQITYQVLFGFGALKVGPRRVPPDLSMACRAYFAALSPARRAREVPLDLSVAIRARVSAFSPARRAREVPPDLSLASRGPLSAFSPAPRALEVPPDLSLLVRVYIQASKGGILNTRLASPQKHYGSN